MTSFNDLGLTPDLVQTVKELGYAEPTPIQAKAIPALLAGRDVMGQAQTGTGKTAAFTLPMLARLKGDRLQALILAPTRELANQVSEAVYRYGKNMGVRVLPIYGGQPYSRQKRRLEKGVHVVVGTPGRILDLINQGALRLGDVRYLVLDEADEMLKMGFIEDVSAIIAAASHPDRQTAIFSATLPKEIQRLAANHMVEPEHIAVETETVTVERVSQRHYVVNQNDKVAALSRLLEVEDLQNTLIFTRTKMGADELAETLMARGYPAEAMHGDLAQAERERILRRFRNGLSTILVATDVVARGVDIPAVSHVINFDIPQLPIEYVHRIGRTGRAGRAGDAITIITPRQRKQLKGIEAYTGSPIAKGKLPTEQDVRRQRERRLGDQIAKQLEARIDESTIEIVEWLLDSGLSLEEVAASAVQLLRAEEDQRPLEEIREAREEREKSRSNGRRGERNNKRSSRSVGPSSHEPGMVRLYMDVGKSDGLKPGDVVFNLASEANVSGRKIGAINIRQHETFVDVHESILKPVLKAMQNGKIRGKTVTVEVAEGLFAEG